jgi:60 kDa SS-A/Ro ribonucleoprotein
MVSTFIEALRPITPQVDTHEGGTAYEADKWTRLRRFLLMGTSGGTYYVGERDHTMDNIGVIKECLAESGSRVVEEIMAIGESGRAPKHDPVLFALALATTVDDKATRKLAYVCIPAVCRTGTHILHLAAYREALGGGWGRGFKGSIAQWFLQKDADWLAYQAIKYPSRDKWSLADLLRLSHPKTDDPDRNAVFKWIVDGNVTLKEGFNHLPKKIVARDYLHHNVTPQEGAGHIRAHRLPREAVPSEMLNNPEVWDALLQDMPMTAMIRNLGKMSAVGLLVQGSDAARRVRDRLEDADRLRKARVHPISILSALKVYEQGHGEKGSLTWRAVKSIVTALDEAFYLAFGAVEPTGKNILCAIDVSGSMTALASGMANMSCREVAGAMALVTLATEPNAQILAFDTSLYDPEIRPTMRLDEVRRIVASLPGGGTDCAIPIRWAWEEKKQFDAIVQYTDSETRTRDHHHLIDLYRRQVSKKARNVLVMAAANGLTLADPNNPLDFDVAGFDANVPNLVGEFVAGRV